MGLLIPPFNRGGRPAFGQAGGQRSATRPHRDSCCVLCARNTSGTSGVAGWWENDGGMAQLTDAKENDGGGAAASMR